VSGEGYYRNAYDLTSAVELPSKLLGVRGSGNVVLCAHDPLTGVDHSQTVVKAPKNAVLNVDSVFAFRPAYDRCWDFRIWLDAPDAVSLARGVERDTEHEGADEALRLHRDRYHAAELIYVAEVNPRSKADLVIDNTDFANPRIMKTRGTSLTLRSA
jgi:uridine kinase